MAFLVATDVKTWLDEFDFSGQMNAVALDYSAELKEATAMGDTAIRRLAALPFVSASMAGNWGSSVDKELADRVSLVDKILSFAPEGNSEGNRGFTFRAAAGKYNFGAAIGEVFPFGFDAEGSAGDPLVAGMLMHDAARTATGNGIGQQLGAIAAATNSIYGALHVTAVSGSSPTLDLTVESDDNSGFTSASVRMTYTQATGLTSQWKELAGPITDDWWRVVYTIGGGSPSFDFAFVLGIV